MSEIRVIWHGHEPNFPATDQHPDAERFYVYASGKIIAAPVKGIPGQEIPASADTTLPEDERQRLAAEEGKRARAAKDARLAAAAGAQPLYVVDSIGEPTMEEIRKVLDGAQEATSFPAGE